MYICARPCVSAVKVDALNEFLDGAGRTRRVSKSDKLAKNVPDGQNIRPCQQSGHETWTFWPVSRWEVFCFPSAGPKRRTGQSDKSQHKIIDTDERKCRRIKWMTVAMMRPWSRSYTVTRRNGNGNTATQTAAETESVERQKLMTKPLALSRSRSSLLNDRKHGPRVFDSFQPPVMDSVIRHLHTYSSEADDCCSSSLATARQSSISIQNGSLC